MAALRSRRGPRDRGAPGRLCLSRGEDAHYDRPVAFWSDIFTLETWAQAAARGYSVTGFPPPTRGRGGYSIGMFERVEIGDVLLCYCKSPASRWVGALRVTGGVFQSEEPVWGLTQDGTARYPWRYPAEPLVTLTPE